MQTETKTVPQTWYTFNIPGCTHSDFHICAFYCYCFMRSLQIFIGQSVAFMTGHLFTFLVVVLSLICSATMKILICENQTIWRLEIRLRKILATLLKAKCRGHFVKNKRYQETGEEYFTIVQMIVKEEVTNILLLEQHLMPDYAHPAYPPPHKHTHTQTHTHAHTNKKRHWLPNDLSPSHLQPTQPFFQFPSRWIHKFSYHTAAQK